MDIREKTQNDAIMKYVGSAYHEAAHAVAAIMFSYPMLYVTITPTEEDESIGHINCEPTPRQKGDREAFRNYSIFLLAPQVAHRLLVPTLVVNRSHYEDDIRNFRAECRE